jgi:hypothetical protein
MDIFPTIADIVDLPESSLVSPIDGSSIKELFTHDIKTRNKPIPFRHEGRVALIDNNYKLLSLDVDKGVFELYDLKNDPNETRNLIDEEVGVAKRMIEEFTNWNKSVEASIIGRDYPGGLNEPNGYRVFWNTLPEYEPYFEQWRNRPEYKSILKKEE